MNFPSKNAWHHIWIVVLFETIFLTVGSNYAPLGNTCHDITQSWSNPFEVCWIWFFLNLELHSLRISKYPVYQSNCKSQTSHIIQTLRHFKHVRNSIQFVLDTFEENIEIRHFFIKWKIKRHRFPVLYLKYNFQISQEALFPVTYDIHMEKFCCVNYFLHNAQWPSATINFDER